MDRQRRPDAFGGRGLEQPRANSHLACTDHYLAHLEGTKSAGTALSYKMELDRAVDYLGAETPIGTLTPFDGLTINFGGAYNDAVYTDWSTATCPNDRR